MSQTVHQPILVAPIVETLLADLDARLGALHGSTVFVDCTFGGGGHARAFLDSLPSQWRLLAIDQDQSALERGKSRFRSEIESARLELVHSPFSELPSLLKQRDLRVGGLLADFGFSSDQLESAERGLSFLREGPVDMRLDPSRGRSARECLLHLTEKEIADCLWEFGEERNSRRIARLLVKARSEEGIPETTTELASLISGRSRFRSGMVGSIPRLGLFRHSEF